MTTRTRIKVRMVIFNILSVSTANDCNEAANFFLTKKKKKKLMLVNQDQNPCLLHFNLGTYIRDLGFIPRLYQKLIGVLA